MNERTRDSRRLLITGGGGFVGRHMLANLMREREPGDRIILAGRSSLPTHIDVENCKLDLLDSESVERLIQSLVPTHILHLAAVSSVHQAANSPAQTWHNNVGGLLNLCTAVTKYAAGAQFIFISSGEVYGRAFLAGDSLTEDTIPLPANLYARTKRAGEFLVADILGSTSTSYVILRPFNHIGPGQDERFVIASFAGQIARIEVGLAAPVVEVGDLSAQRDFLDVEDVTNAYRAVVDASDKLPQTAIFNVSSGNARSIDQLLVMLKKHANVNFEIRLSPDRMRPAEIPFAAGNPTALIEAVGWKPSIPIETTIHRILHAARLRINQSTSD
ncbi:NAD-dependent epimerase/dehydratase family protein [Methylorubrum aminovorans]|nr:GDP-mannose 4,6-dehydratase [Methylorubrum aminovorans]